MRVDQDGDLDMDAARRSARNRGAGRGSRGASQPRGNAGSRFGPMRDTNGSRATRGGVDPAAMQKAILRGMDIDGRVPRGPKLNLRTIKPAERSLVKERDPNVRARWEQIIVRGFQNSKAASNPDGGIKDLIGFLERKATPTDASARDLVRVKKVCLTLCFPGHRCQRNFGLSGPLSFQAKLSERRPRYSSLPIPPIGDLQRQGLYALLTLCSLDSMVTRSSYP